jgi:hypothetical protein
MVNAMGATRKIVALHAATAQLTALTGTEPRTVKDPGAGTVRIDVTPELRGQWQRLLPIFDLCDRFGLKGTPAGQTLWLRFDLTQDGR